MITGLSHVSIAVPSLNAAAKRLKEIYALDVGEAKVNEQQGVRLAYVDAFVHLGHFLGALVELEEQGGRRKDEGGRSKPMIRGVSLLGIIISTLVPVAAAQQSPGDAYPNRPIRLLIPFAPGGATDIIARMIEPKMSRALGQQVVVDNRPGAAGNIAVELTAQAQPDGYTLLVGNISTNSINPILFAKQMKANAPKDLTGVTKLVAIPNFILGSPKLPANTLKEAIAYAKGHPDQLNFQAPLARVYRIDFGTTCIVGKKLASRV